MMHFIHKWHRKKWRFFAESTGTWSINGEPPACHRSFILNKPFDVAPDASSVFQVRHKTTTKNQEFSLCLSRVCLGKMIVFIYKWLNKWRFSHESYPPLIFDRFR
eukprot:COSAG06_NODE_405_length_16132_cov_9.166532_21_plen_104_part_01